MAGDEPVTSPDQHRPTISAKLSRFGAVVTILVLLAMTVGNHEGKAFIWCSKYNTYGNLWYYVRDSSSNTVGWVWSGNVSSVVGSNHATC